MATQSYRGWCCAVIVAVVTISCKTDDHSSFAALQNLEAPAAINEQSLVATCQFAQAVVGGYDAAAIKSRTTVQSFAQIEEFLESKPEIGTDALALTAFRPTAGQALSEYGNIWCKLKGANDLGASNALPGFKRTTEPANCDSAARQLWEHELVNEPLLAQSIAQRGIAVTFTNKTLRTGGQWAPSTVRIAVVAEKHVTIETTSLESPRGLPRIGGMNYCKLPSPDGLRALAKDLAQLDFDYVSVDSRITPRSWLKADVDYAEVTYNAVLGGTLPQRASLYYTRDTRRRTGTIVISPGGGVAPVQMRGLAQALARRGLVVYVVHYPLDLAIVEKFTGRNNSAINLGRLLREQRLNELNGLPPELRSFYEQGRGTLTVLGHSLGGAILASVIFTADSPFDAVVTFGTSSYVKTGDDTFRAKVYHSYFGEQDGLSLDTPEALPQYRQKYGFVAELSAQRWQGSSGSHYLEVIPQLNHFCVLSDLDLSTLGRQRVKEDRAGLAPRACIPALIAKLVERGIVP